MNYGIIRSHRAKTEEVVTDRKQKKSQSQGRCVLVGKLLKIGQAILAEREGFEPSVQVLARTTV
jgi:hypothetical protein